MMQILETVSDVIFGLLLFGVIGLSFAYIIDVCRQKKIE
ncbi:hypothetical protein DESAMIL20_654 [Desulfurella amilsii]|jgi:hypothetical protein|uniref:Uncharacterized protein n=1 Tax=Desulfurella amilsii TaxID=1562698 RepID=A0A1X4XYC8_9BACT|nr:hypothetical protein DESAMIL20_654 [Desulfurella amilsii]